MTRLRTTEAAVFTLLVAIAVVGRLGQPDWCVTPLAAVGLFAGRWFADRRLALAAPVVAMAASDLILPRYGSGLVVAAVYGSLVAAPLLGRLMRRPAGSRGAAFARLATLAPLPAVVFFLATNLAVWWAWPQYEKSLSGLASCYAAAVPFFWKMVAGDIAYVAALFGAAELAGAFRCAPAAAERR